MSDQNKKCKYKHNLKVKLLVFVIYFMSFLTYFCSNAWIYINHHFFSNIENETKITLTEALYLLNDARKHQDMQGSGGANAMMGGNSSIGPLMNMNDDVIKKTNQYLDRFVRFQNVEVSRQMRKVAREHQIEVELCINIADLGLLEYDEVISLFPAAK